MKENFDKAFELLMDFEGGYSDDIFDAGGKTMYGISINSFPKEFNELMALKTPKEREEYIRNFYRKNFWDVIKADSLPDKTDIAAFDFAVNSGAGRAKRLLDVTQDWKDYIFYRIDFLIGIGKGTNSKYIRGWVNRCVRLWKALKEG